MTRSRSSVIHRVCPGGRLSMETISIRSERSTAASPVLRPARPYEQAAIESVWSASQDADEPLGRPHQGWWSISNWATAIHVLVQGKQVIGFAAIEYQSGAEAAEARIALLPPRR